MSHADTPPRLTPDPAARPRADLLMSRLQEVTERLAAARGEEDVFAVVLQPAMEALGARSGTVLLVQEGGLRTVAHRGSEETGVWQDGSLEDDTPAADVLRGGQPLFFEHGGSLTAAYPELEARTGGRAAVASAVLPMFLDGGPLGVLVLDFPEPHTFTPEETRFLRTLASQAALALGRSRAAREVRESHDRLVLTLQAGGFGLWEWELGTGLLRRAPETMRLLGTDREVAPFEDYLNRIHPDDRERVQAAFEGARQDGTSSFVVQHRHTRGDGRQVWIEQHTRVERDAEGRAVRLLGVTADITARREAEEERARLARLVEESTDFIGIADLSGQGVYVNAAGRQLVGLGGPEDVRRLNVLDVFTPEDRPFVQEVILPQTLEKGRWEGDFRFRHFGTGEAVDVAYNMFALTDPQGGQPVAFATVTRDVRGRKRQERELQALNRDLERRVAERTRRLEEEARAREAFVAFTEAVGTETDVTALVRRAIEVLHAHFPHGGSVGYYEREGELWKGRLGSGNSPEAFNRAVGAGLPGDTPVIARMLREEKAVFAEGWDAGREGVAGSEVYGAVACYPLVAGGEVRAFLGVALRGTRQWQERDRALVRAVGRGLGLALERTEAARRLREQNEELDARTRALEAFAALTRDLSVQAEPWALVRRAQEVVLSLLPEGYAVYFEPEGGRWHKRVQTGDMRSASLQRRVDAGFPLGEPPGLVVPWQTRQSHYQDEYASGNDRDSALVEHAGTVASLPVLVNGEVAGVMGFVLFGARAWTRADRAAMETVVHSLGLALEGARQAREITEWRRRYEVAVQGSGHLLYDWDPATDLIVYGGGAEHITGYTPGELAGNLADWTERLIHPGDRAAFRREIARVVGTSDEFHLAFRIVRRDGQVREVEDDGYFMRGEGGRLTRMVGFVKDVTERNRTEAERARLARLVEESSDYIGITDADGKITYLNAAGRRLIGLAPGADPGRMLDNVHRDDRERFETAILPLVDRVGRWQGDVTLRHAGTGEPIAANRTVFTLTDPRTGRPGGYATITRDIRKRKAAEEALRRANLELQRSNAELEQFAYVASHDLQEPLRTVTSFAGLLASRYAGQLDPKADLYIRLITEGTGRMARLLNDLLAFARVSNTARPPAPVDTAFLAAQVVQDLHAQIERGGARVHLGELPAVLGDASQLRQLFQNLLGNALKFRHPARAPEVWIEAEVDGPLARFSVRDNGIGIAPEFHERIFTIFQRLHTRETYEGSGIGLSIARKIVERHGGRLWPESREGEGTAFLFTLPLAPGRAAPGGEG